MRSFLAAATGAAAVLALAARPAESPHIVFVDMSKLVSEHRQSREEQQLIQQWQEATEKLLDERQKSYNQEVSELDQFRPDSDEWRRKSRELRVKKFELEADVSAYKEERERRVARSISDSHARVVDASRKYLEASDLDAILQYASSPVSGANRSEVIPEIVVRTVVAHRKTMDATDAVLAILDGGK
jgi:Skp family chaperone for outer membrane proteins